MITLSEIYNFADDNTLYSSNKELEIVFRNLEFNLNNVSAWFNIKSLKANPGKFQFMALGKKEDDPSVLNIGKNKIESWAEVTLLGVKIEKQLKFKSHIAELCRKVVYKLHALRRIRKYLTAEKAKLLANAFINSQFTYAPLIWMFAGKSSIGKICKTFFRTLQIVYNNYDKSYHELLNFSDDVSIHQKHFRFLAIEVYKSFISILSSYENFSIKIQFSTIYENLPPARPSYVINSQALCASLLWKGLSSNVKQSHNVEEFKLKSRNLGHIHCTCVVCRWN